MVSRRGGKKEERDLRPATTIEGRENQLVSMAMDLAEQRIRNGTATSQELSHFLKLGSTREKLEQERLRQENLLTEAKIRSQANDADTKELLERAMAAFSTYRGDSVDDPEYD